MDRRDERRAFCQTLGVAAATGALACAGCSGSQGSWIGDGRDGGVGDALGGHVDLSGASPDLAHRFDLATLPDLTRPADLKEPPDMAKLNGSCPQTARDTKLLATQFPLGAAIYLAGDQVYICHDQGGLYCLDAHCTHAGCAVNFVKGGFDCPCHGSVFTYNGIVTAGPAATPLPHYALCLTANKTVAYDLLTTVSVNVRYNL